MCWHSGVKERNQSCPKNSCNEPALCKGRQKKSLFSYATLDTLEQLKKSHLISRTTMQTVHSSRQRESDHTMPKARKCDGVSQNLWIGFRSFWRQLKLLYQALGTPPSVTRKHSSRKIWHCHFTTFKKMSSFISTIMTWIVWKSATRIPKAVLCSSSYCLMSHQWRTPNQGQSDHWQKTRSVCCQRRPPCETLFQTSVWLLAGSKHNQEKCLCLRVTATSRESPADQEACLGHSLGQQKAASRAGMPNSIRLRMQTWESCMRPSYWVLDHTDNQQAATSAWHTLNNGH